MEFMVKTQYGNLVSGNSFEKIKVLKMDGADKFGIKTEWGTVFSCKTEERRDEVMAELEEWIGWMIFYNAFGANEVIMKENSYGTAPFMIFTFPKE